MTFKFPRTATGKKFASANYDFVIPLTLNETNIERMLVQILERLVKHGRTSPPHRGDTHGDALLDFESLLNQLAENPKLDGFNSDEGKALLSGWLRTNIVVMNPAGKKRNEIQIDYLKPLSVAVYRSGFSRQRSRHRRADQLVYRSILKEWQKKSASGTASNLMSHLVNTGSSVFAGVDFSQATHPHSNPVFNEQDQVDINSLLALRYLEAIPGRDPIQRGRGVIVNGLMVDPDSVPLDDPLPEAGEPVGIDFLNFLMTYGNRSAGEVISALQCILAFRLYQYPIKAAASLQGLRENQKTDSNQLEMYFDFTNVSGQASSELAKRCVERDLKSLANLFRDLIYIREVEMSARPVKEIQDLLTSLTPNERLIELAKLTHNPGVEYGAGIQLEAVKKDLEEQGEEQNLLEFLRIKKSTKTNIDALVQLVLDDRERAALDGYRKWAYSTGGLTDKRERPDYALLSGVMRHPSTWRYSMTEPMLLALIDLCFLDEKGRETQNTRMQVTTLLNRLEGRFGILIGRPPVEFDNPENRIAANQNLAAFTQLLKNLGYFEGLSDDFSAQHIARPTSVRNK
jgi:hypothetical protein